MSSDIEIHGLDWIYYRSEFGHLLVYIPLSGTERYTAPSQQYIKLIPI